MTRERVKELLPVMQAFAEGKEIQYRLGEKKVWEDCSIPNWYDSMEYRIKPDENYTIEQNTGENRVESGILSVSGSVSEKHYRPFKDCSELIETFQNKCQSELGGSIVYPTLYKPCIWVKGKYDSNVVLLITGFTITDDGVSCVWLTDSWISLETLYDDWVFMDASPCGVEDVL